MALETFKTSTIPLYIMGIVGFFLVFAFYFPFDVATEAARTISDWVSIISTFILFVTVLSIFLFEYKQINMRRKNWFLSVWFMIAALISLVLFLISGSPQAEPYFTWYDNTFGTINTATLAMLGFFIGVAMYRAFRIRSIESGIISVMAIVILFGWSTVGQAILPASIVIKDYVFDVLSVGANRAMAIASNGAILLVLVRILMGFEKRVFGG